MNLMPKLSSEDLKQANVLPHTVDPAQRELAKSISTALNSAKGRGQPFMLEWRPQAKRPRWEIAHDEGCGCGPIDVAGPAIASGPLPK
jgi:hypothetical protein